MTNIKFLHIRRPTVAVRRDGLTIERAGPFGGITVAYRAFNDIGGYHLAVARCRNDERYNKKLGREEAAKKLMGDADWTMTCFNVEKDESPLEYIAGYVYSKSALRKNLRPAITGVTK